MDIQKKFEQRKFNSDGFKKGKHNGTKRKKRALKRAAKMFAWNETIQELLKLEKE